MKEPISHTEKMYLENQEYEKKNQEEVKKPKVSKAAAFRKEHGYSLTMSKLMKKWGCATQDEYRAIRRQHKKENYVGPKKEKKAAPATATYQHSNNYRGGNKNNNRNRR